MVDGRLAYGRGQKEHGFSRIARMNTDFKIEVWNG